MNFEDDLRRALQRELAPPGFAARVIAKARPKRHFNLAMAAALALAALIPSGIYQYRQREKAIKARDQLIVALSITRDQLQQVGEKIQHHKRQR